MTDIDKYSDDFRAYVVSAACSIPAGTAWDSPEMARTWGIWQAARASTPPPAAEPEFCLDPDGELCMDWDIAGARLSVSIGGVGRVSWAMLAGDKKACGSRLFENERAVPVGLAAPAVQAVGGESDRFTQMILAELARRGASHAALRLATQIFGVAPCDDCGYRKLYCRCATPAIQPPPSAKPAPTDPRQVVGIVDERYLRPTIDGEG